MLSRGFREDVLMLSIADNQNTLALALPHDEFESIIGRIDGNERDGSIVVLSRCNRAFPLAEIEGGYSVLCQNGKLPELFTGIALCQTSH